MILRDGLTETKQHTAGQREWLDGMRALIEFCEDHPDATPEGSPNQCLLMLYCDSVEEWAMTVGVLGDGASTEVEAVSHDEFYLRYVRSFGPHRLQAYMARGDLR